MRWNFCASNINSLTSKLKNQLKLCRQIYRELNLENHEESRQDYSLVMLNEMFLLANNCLVILEHGKSNISGIPALVRYSLEIRLDILLNCENENYHLNIECFSIVQEIKLHKYDLSEDWPWASVEMKKIVRELEVKREKLKKEMELKKLAETFNVERKIDLLQDESEKKLLYPVYRRLSSWSHSNVSAMKDKRNLQEYNCYFSVNALSDSFSKILNAMLEIFPKINQKKLKEVSGIANSIYKIYREYEEQLNIRLQRSL